MTEINKSIVNYGYGLDKIEKQPKKEQPKRENNEANKSDEQKYTPDTGVLGRSQVNSSSGANIAKSVDEAVALASKRPQILTSSDEMFNSIYQKLISEGMDESEAYLQAIMAEDEFLSLVNCH